MKRATIVLDLGHSIFKGKRSTGDEVVIPHAIVPISDTQYRDAVQRYGRSIPRDILRINGTCYAVGESAESFGAITKRTGTGRYTPDYIGIAAMATISHLYGSSGIDADIFASHPPTHNQYAEDLQDAIFGERDEWLIENGHREMIVKVNYVNCFDESTGGLMNVMLTQDGTHYQRPELKTSRIIAIDIGGGTTDFTVMDNGEIDYLNPHSEPMGINKVISDFERAFRSRYKKETKGTNSLNPKRVRDAIVDGIFKAGGRELPCHEEAMQARNRLLNAVLEVFQGNFGGAFSYDGILLTGGGSALMYDSICENVQHDNIMLADDVDSLHLANVRGGLKLWKLYERLGVV